MPFRNTKFGARLKKLRGSRPLKEIADLAEVTPTAIYHYEGGRIPRGEILFKLASIYGTSVADLLSDNEGQVAEPPEPYGDLERSDRKTLDEVAELLRAADSETKGDLKHEINKIQRLAKLPKKRA